VLKRVAGFQLCFKSIDVPNLKKHSVLYAPDLKSVRDYSCDTLEALYYPNVFYASLK
jgi:hypothetical protein